MDKLRVVKKASQDGRVTSKLDLQEKYSQPERVGGKIYSRQKEQRQARFRSFFL